MDVARLDGTTVTTQREVADAFFRGDNEPSTASNLDLLVMDDGYTAALVSDEIHVLAERRPLDDFTVYSYGPPFSQIPYDGMTMGHVRRQQRKVIASALATEGVLSTRSDAERANAPHVNEFINEYEQQQLPSITSA